MTAPTKPCSSRVSQERSMLQTFFFPLKLWPPELACFLKGPNLFLALLVFFFVLSYDVGCWHAATSHCIFRHFRFSLRVPTIVHRRMQYSVHALDRNKRRGGGIAWQPAKKEEPDFSRVPKLRKKNCTVAFYPNIYFYFIKTDLASPPASG